MAGPFEMSRNAVVIDAPAERVFEYVADMTRHGEWNPEPDFEVTAFPEEPPHVGAVFRRQKMGVMRGPLIIRGGMSDNPVRLVKTMTVTALEPHSRLAFDTSNSYNDLLVSIDKISFEFRQETEGTRVIMISRVEALVPGAFMGPAYAMRIARGFFTRILGGKLTDSAPKLPAGPHLSRIKEMIETGKAVTRI